MTALSAAALLLALALPAAAQPPAPPPPSAPPAPPAARALPAPPAPPAPPPPPAEPWPLAEAFAGAFADQWSVDLHGALADLPAIAGQWSVDVHAAMAEAQATLIDARVWERADAAVAEALGATSWSVAPLPPASSFGGAALADLRSTAPEPWAQGDPADSLYRIAREALNRGDFRRAATLFRDLATRHARSAYAADAAYWEAFARYRLRSEPELRQALQVLDAQIARGVSSATTADAKALATRIRGELAGWASASGGASRAWSQQLQQTARAGDGCDREEAAVRIEALGALAKIDSAAVVPTARRVLADQATCAASLRERAVLILGRSGAPAAIELLASAARADASPSVRAAALASLARSRDDRAVATIEEVLRSATDERTTSAAVSALARSEHPRAHPALRALAERADAPLRARGYAIAELGRDTTSGDAAWLRALYPRLDSARLKEGVLNAVARQPGAESGSWLAGIARDANEPMRLRRAALAAYARRDVPVAELARLYDATAEPELRDALVGTFARRREPEATDKLLAIARSDSSPRLRRAAIGALTRKDDPRTTRLLMEIIDRQ